MLLILKMRYTKVRPHSRILLQIWRGLFCTIIAFLWGRNNVEKNRPNTMSEVDIYLRWLKPCKDGYESLYKLLFWFLFFWSKLWMLLYLERLCRNRVKSFPQRTLFCTPNQYDFIGNHAASFCQSGVVIKYYVIIIIIITKLSGNSNILTFLVSSSKVLERQ